MKRARTSLVGGGRVGRPLPRALEALCRARLDSVTFRRELRARLRDVLAFDAYCVNTVDPETLVVTSSIGDGLSSDAARRLFELEEAARDFNRLADLAQGPAHVATMYRATAGDVTRSQRMRELFLPLGWRDELRAALVVDGACWGYLHLFRGSSRAPFAPHELEGVDQARPLIAAALRAACLVGAPLVVHPAPAVVLLDGRGSIVEESAAARSWLDALLPDVGGATPHPLHVVSARSRSMPVTARYRTPRGDWMSFHGTRLGAGVALLLGAASASEVAPMLLLAHGLTARERDVGGLLLRGRSNAEIAVALGISLHTTKDHVKAILAKTKAASRAAFAARFAG